MNDTASEPDPAVRSNWQDRLTWGYASMCVGAVVVVLSLLLFASALIEDVSDAKPHESVFGWTVAIFGCPLAIVSSALLAGASVARLPQKDRRIFATAAILGFSPWLVFALACLGVLRL